MSAILNPLPEQKPPAGGRPAVVPTPEPPSGGRNWLVLVSLGLALVAGIGAWRWYQSQQEQAAKAALPAIRTAKARLGQLNQSTRLEGTTAARNFVNVTVPKLTGPEANRPMVILKMATSGSWVKKGELVLEIDGQSLADHVDDVHSTVLQAEADEKKRQAEHALDMENLLQNVRVAKAELDKVQFDLKAKELRPTVDQEILGLAADEARAKYEQLLKEVDWKKKQQAAEMKILEYTTNRHRRHRDRHKADLKKFVVYASMDGMAVVQSMFRSGQFDTLKVGDNVGSGQLAMKIVDPKSMHVEAKINQSEATNFRLGQKASITFDAYNDLRLPGTVYSIGAIAVTPARQQNYLRTIPVRISIDATSDRLIPDLSAAADVTTELAQDKAVIIPRSGLVEEGGKFFVYVKQSANFLKKQVDAGMMNFTHASVQSGLREGEEVALNYAPVSKEAQQVAAR
ncbi:MAG: HlyD family efflux transporter periplasmic adaptor subunit [Bryobacter sp.]|nr:HlyD family efflux transporter periplasmic adaptor subunit [Bryobacter sp.]